MGFRFFLLVSNDCATNLKAMELFDRVRNYALMKRNHSHKLDPTGITGKSSKLLNIHEKILYMCLCTEGYISYPINGLLMKIGFE